jgi:hypothetical protein
MAKVIARNAKIIQDGKDLSGEYNNCVMTLSAEVPEVTSFGDNTKQRLSNSIQDSELKIDGFWNNSPSSTDAYLSEVLSGSGNVVFFPIGYTASNAGYAMIGTYGNYEIKGNTSEACNVSMTIGGAPEKRIKSLGYNSAASAVTASGATVDFTAADANTVHYFIHIMSASTSISACIMHSSNDSTYTAASDLGALTGPGKSYYGTISSASRYRAIRYTMTGGSGIILATLSGSSF